MFVVSKKQARKFLLKKQLLTDKPKSGHEGIKHVFETLRVIQYDPLNPCGRNPDLVLQSRVDHYHPEDYFQWLYREKKGIECYDKALCIIPIEDFVLTSHNRKNIIERPQLRKFIKTRKNDLEELLKFIDKKGPVSSSDIESQEIIPGEGWYGYGSRWGKVALEILWKTGRIVVTKRIKGNKYYDLPQKAYDGDYFGIDKKVEEGHILRRVGSIGLMRASGSGDAWMGLGTVKHVSKLITGLIKKGELTLVEVDGLKKKYLILSRDQKIFNQKIRLNNRMRFIAPLDTLVWDRKMIEELFRFRYRWEVYTPKVKREYGYYVLPIIYRDQFVGRIEPVLQGETLVIKNIWKEKTTLWTEGMDKDLKRAIERFRKYLGAEKIMK